MSTTATNNADNDCLSTLMNSSPRNEVVGCSNYKSHAEPGGDVSVIQSSSSDAAASSSPPLCFSYWDRTTFLSDFIAKGLEYLDVTNDVDASSQESRRDGRRHHRQHHRRRHQRRRAIMLYEAPSTYYATGTTFHNEYQYRVHDYPPAPVYVKTVMDPCRYAIGNGSAFPSYLKNGSPPPGLMVHWEATIPNWVKPSFTDCIPALQSPTNHGHNEKGGDQASSDPVLVYAYLPCEALARNYHVNDPTIHYYLCGKDILERITTRTPRLLPSTQPCYRPCIVKATHASGSRGIFVIRNDHDEQAFHAYWEGANHPPFVITELVSDIRRNVACHFFIHPNGRDITILGSSENFRFDDDEDNDGHAEPSPNLPFSSDSYWSWSDQDPLRDMQGGLVEEVARYCHSLGFWGFCGIDVLQDTSGCCHLIDVNPRVTGSLPSLLVANLLHGRYGYNHGIFRRSGPATYYLGPSQQLLEDVALFNREHLVECQVVVFAYYELPTHEQNNRHVVTKIQMGVYGHSLDQCRQVLDGFSKKVLMEE